jgi:2-methylcitrate dehydratase PrpD
VSHSAATIETTFAGFLGSLAGDDIIPPTVRTAVAQHTLEIFSGLFAGADIPEILPVLHSYARSDGVAAVATTVFRSESALAAGAMAALSHAAELDPIHAFTVICPAAVTIPAALAIAQTMQLSGTRYVAAVCAGYEAAIRLGRALDGAQLLSAGWWPTAVCGSFAAAATSAICMGLSAEQLQDALGLAAIHSGGLAIGGPNAPVARNLLCAHTVRVGVDAAMAARSGVAGPRDLFSGPRSFLSAFARPDDAAPLVARAEDGWAILDTSLKRWPCALQAQSALDALARLASGRRGGAPILAVEIRLPGVTQRMVNRPGVPPTRWAAAGSLQFLAASLLLDGDISDSRMNLGRSDPKVLELMQRIHVLADSSLDGRYPKEWPACVRLLDSQGERVAESSLPPGHPSRALSFEFSEARFRQHASLRLSSEMMDSVVLFVKSLDRQRNVAAIVSLLRPRQ